MLIPHYNNPEGLLNSVASIGPTENVDVLVVDDGSNVRFQETKICQSARFGGQIFFIYLSQNQGIGAALNAGLAWIGSRDYQYVARLDCGDLCHPKRFEKQEAFLSQNPEVALVGSWALYVDEAGEKLLEMKPPTTDAEIRRKIFLFCPFVHPSIFFRVGVLDNVSHYNHARNVAEDYTFYFKILKNHRVANISEFLLTYQVISQSVSAQKRRSGLLSSLRVLRQNFYWGWYPVFGIAKHTLAFFISRNTALHLRRYWPR